MSFDKMRLLNIDAINRDTRPRLYEMASIVSGEAYVLSSETLSDAEDDEKILALLVGEGNLLLIEDTPKSEDGVDDETFKAILIDGEARENLAKILAPMPTKARKESTGRPKLYFDDVAQSVFTDNFMEGLSIKKISFKRNMSPTTVQKLLNEYRLKLADKIADGNDIPILGNDAESKLKILEWAISRTEGEKRRKFEQAYFKMSSI